MPAILGMSFEAVACGACSRPHASKANSLMMLCLGKPSFAWEPVMSMPLAVVIATWTGGLGV